MKPLLVFLFLGSICVAGSGFRGGWRGAGGVGGGSATHDTLTVHDTLVGPTITITATDPSGFASGFLTAEVTWGDGEEVEVFALARLTQTLPDLVCFIKGEWGGVNFSFRDENAAQAIFISEGLVTFTAYARDSNGMIATDEKTITLAE